MNDIHNDIDAFSERFFLNITVRWH